MIWFSYLEDWVGILGCDYYFYDFIYFNWNKDRELSGCYEGNEGSEGSEGKEFNCY